MSTEVPSIVPNLEGIGRLIRDGVLQVPTYQRSYSWGPEQVQTFWHDLRAALVAGDPLYFLGAVVISSSGNTDRSTVIDGQQRLATTCMLIAAIRDVFRVKGDESRAETIQQRYI